jgi:hypothetical protein
LQACCKREQFQQQQVEGNNMAGIDKQYVRINDFQQVFRDKTSGAPLTGGYIEFFEDLARSTTREVWMLTGSVPSYTYASLGNKVYFNAVGTFSSSIAGTDDISVFYKPYDASGNIVRYYARVYDAEDVFQFDREALPNITIETDEQDELINYIPNGQFALHNYLPANTLGSAAPGGWWASTDVTAATDNISFIRFGSYVSNPTGNPRYALRWICSAVGTGGTFKALAIRFSNVNTFASETQKYTFAFSAKSNTSDTTINFELAKHFGSGGSAEVDTNISVFPITTSYDKYQVSFIFGTNEGKTIGSNNDDYIDLVISLPTTATFDLEFTDFILTLGEHDIDIYPDLTTYESAYKALFNPIDSDGVNYIVGGHNDIPNYYMHLPVYKRPTGYVASTVDIGKVFASVYTVPTLGELLCNGAGYDPAGYSSDLIPYKRLADALWSAATGHYMFGSGKDYVECYQLAGATNALILVSGTAGTCTSTADGTNATTFTFANVHVGNATYDFVANHSDKIYVVCNTIGTAKTQAGAGTSGFTVETSSIGCSNFVSPTLSVSTNLSDFSVGGQIVLPTRTGAYRVQIDGAGIPDTFKWSNDGGATWEASTVNITGAAQTLENGLTITFAATTGHTNGDYWDIYITQDKQSVAITPIAAAGLAGGEHFLLSNTTEDFYIWFKVGGVGVDPAVGTATGIEVDLLGTETLADMNLILSKVINGLYISSIQTVAAASMPESSYFDYYTQAGLYYYLWTNQGSGVDPANGGVTKALELTLAGTETAAQVAFAVLSAINEANYALPDLRNKFISCWGMAAGLNPEALVRYARGDGIYGDAIGTFQENANRSHAHNNLEGQKGDTKHDDNANRLDNSAVIATSSEGEAKARPDNMQLNFVIKY